MGEKQETVPEVTEKVEAVRVSLEDVGKMASEICRLRQQVDALQERGTKFQLERQDARRSLRIIANRTHVGSAADLAREHLRVFYDGWEKKGTDTTTVSVDDE